VLTFGFDPISSSLADNELSIACSSDAGLPIQEIKVSQSPIATEPKEDPSGGSYAHQSPFAVEQI